MTSSVSSMTLCQSLSSLTPTSRLTRSKRSGAIKRKSSTESFRLTPRVTTDFLQTSRALFVVREGGSYLVAREAYLVKFSYERRFTNDERRHLGPLHGTQD